MLPPAAHQTYMFSRFLAGLTLGLFICVVVIIVLVVPAALLFRLIAGVWPNSSGWLWIGGVLISQTLATAFGYAWRHRNDPKSPPGAHGSAPP